MHNPNPYPDGRWTAARRETSLPHDTCQYWQEAGHSSVATMGRVAQALLPLCGEELELGLVRQGRERSC